MKTAITHYCTIREHTLSQNGKILVSQPMSSQTLDSFLVSAYRHLEMHYPKFFKMDTLCKLAVLATEALLATLKVTYQDTDLGITLGNRSSSILTDLNHQQTIQTKESFFPSPSVFVYTLPNIMMGEVCIRHQIQGENTLFVSEEFDSATLFAYSQYLLEEKICKACICGWIEAGVDSYDAFLYLVEALPAHLSSECPTPLAHTIESINQLYRVPDPLLPETQSPYVTKAVLSIA